MALIGRLPDGPLDIVGDVHGEYEALSSLMRSLGYGADCHSSSGRHLVFLGDLIDRGPDSPAVVDSVKRWVEQCRASCILGNHELLAVIGKPLHGNGWLIQPNSVEAAGEFHSKTANPEKVDEYLGFFESLPAVLENDQLRLVHACWHEESVQQLRELDSSHASLLQVYEDLEQAIPARLDEHGLRAAMAMECEKYGVALHDRSWNGRVLDAHARAEVLTLIANPLRVLTSGRLEVADEAFFASGQWRMANRAKWWESYDDDIPVVIGHFWRRFDKAAKRVAGVFGRDVFEGVGSHEWIGKRKNVYCVDYSVGQRHAERKLRVSDGEYHGKLAALRYPEWEVVHDDGTVVPIANRNDGRRRKL